MRMCVSIPATVDGAVKLSVIHLMLQPNGEKKLKITNGSSHPIWAYTWEWIWILWFEYARVWCLHEIRKKGSSIHKSFDSLLRVSIAFSNHFRVALEHTRVRYAPWLFSRIHSVSAAYSMNNNWQSNEPNERTNIDWRENPDDVPWLHSFLQPIFNFFSFQFVAVDTDAVVIAVVVAFVHSELVADDTLAATTVSVWQGINNSFVRLNVFCCRELLRCFVHLLQWACFHWVCFVLFFVVLWSLLPL